jgi:hypothetical protein
MKKYKQIAAGLLTSALLMTGCSESFLEVESPTQDFIDTYFTTDAHIQEAVVAAYAPLQWPDWSMGQYNPVNIMSDIMADDIWVGGADKTDNQFWHLMMNYEAQSTNCMTGLWTVAYSGVKRSNDVITYLEWAGENVTEEHRNYYTAQVRVLRVFYYNWLWKFWGNIPYYETNLSTPYLAEQLQANQVYQNIITDLEGAIALNALPMKETSSNYGRITKAMAYMLYAEIVMYQKDETRYAKALQYMQEIIASTESYSLVGNYADIFKESGEWGSESIFEINYKDDNAARSWNNPLYSGGTVLPRLIGPSGWTGGVDGHDNGWGFCPVRLETYQRYAANDSRRSATCWDAATAGAYTARYQNTGYFLEKYTAHTGDNADQIADGDLNYNNNLRIYRFAETLLNAAELIVRGAGAGDAKEYLTRVHKRAGLTDEPDATIDNIIEERRLEFAGEGKRYWDLVRTDKAASTLVPDQYGYRTNTWTASKKYLPIPQSEIDAAQGTLVQNNY